MAEDKETLLKFPRTPHIYDLGGSAVTRDDLLLDARDAEALLRTPLTLEEKLDGANLGISITADYRILCQNRSHYVNGETHSQFKRLPQWLAEHQGELFEALEPERHILFGEWLYARHSVPYSRLPDYFLAFDIYDRHAGHFLSRCVSRSAPPPSSPTRRDEREAAQQGARSAAGGHQHSPGAGAV